MSLIKNLHPSLTSAQNCESLERKLGSPDKAEFFVIAIDGDLFSDVSHFDVHKLTLWPTWSHVANHANC